MLNIDSFIGVIVIVNLGDRIIFSWLYRRRMYF